MWANQILATQPQLSPCWNRCRAICRSRMPGRSICCMRAKSTKKSSMRSVVICTSSFMLLSMPVISTFAYPVTRMLSTDKPYIQYASEVAMCLYGLNAGPIAGCAAMIYPPPIVAEKVLDDIKTQFENEQKLVRLVQEMLHLSQFEWDIWQVPLDGNENKERRQTLKKMFLLAIDEIKSEPQEHFSLTTASEFQKKEKQVENVIRLFLAVVRSEEHTSELQSHSDIVCRLLLEKKN